MTDYLTDAQNDIKTYFETHDIPTCFYQCFFGEMVKVWGIKFLTPDKYYDAEYDEDGNMTDSYEDAYSYKEQIDNTLNCLGGTGGWNLAFKEACRQCDLMDIYEDYSKMDWVRSDIFDGYIAEETMKMLFADLYSNDYYMFKIHKERKNER